MSVPLPFIDSTLELVGVTDLTQLPLAAEVSYNNYVEQRNIWVCNERTVARQHFLLRTDQSSDDARIAQVRIERAGDFETKEPSVLLNWSLFSSLISITPKDDNISHEDAQPCATPNNIDLFLSHSRDIPEPNESQRTSFLQYAIDNPFGFLNQIVTESGLPVTKARKDLFSFIATNHPDKQFSKLLMSMFYLTEYVDDLNDMTNVSRPESVQSVSYDDLTFDDLPDMQKDIAEEKFRRKYKIIYKAKYDKPNVQEAIPPPRLSRNFFRIEEPPKIIKSVRDNYKFATIADKIDYTTNYLEGFESSISPQPFYDYVECSDLNMALLHMPTFLEFIRKYRLDFVAKRNKHFINNSFLMDEYYYYFFIKFEVQNQERIAKNKRLEYNNSSKKNYVPIVSKKGDKQSDKRFKRDFKYYSFNKIKGTNYDKYFRGKKQLQQSLVHIKTKIKEVIKISKWNISCYLDNSQNFIFKISYLFSYDDNKYIDKLDDQTIRCLFASLNNEIREILR